jgi:hypothetical protein
MSTEMSGFTYHVLLIGVDRYPPGFNSLRGCVNDIDAIEQLLCEAPGVGIPKEQIQITRLIAPHANYVSTSPFPTESASKANIVAALKRLAGPAVKPTDRVLIYYSGHGDEVQWKGSTVWHEALVPHNGETIEYLFDVEVNALVGAIAQKTDDLTVILDCCHSGGATRDLDGITPEGTLRFLGHKAEPVDAPDLTTLELSSEMSRGMLRAREPAYLVVAACQPDEKAGEGAHPVGAPSHGVFTQSLLSLMANRSPAERAQLRWADIWPTLLARASERNGVLRQRPQHPWLIGRSERKVFGGPWEPMDAGYAVMQKGDSDYVINAGTLMGMTEGAEIAVYGPAPRFFPSLGSPEDQPIGRLKVIKAERAEALATLVGTAFDLPEGARGRMVQPGKSERLRVSIKPAGTQAPALVTASPLLELVPASTPDADVEVMLQPDGSWVLGNDVEPIMAVVPPGEVQALRAGLDHCYRYNALLRFAKQCNDPQVSNYLTLRLLDCNDQARVQAMSPEALADPDLPEAPRDAAGHYSLPGGFRFCVSVTNTSTHPLSVTLFNASVAGYVEPLSAAVVRAGASQVLWVDGQLGRPFVAGADRLPQTVPGIPRPPYLTDRIVAIGTTRKGVDLTYLRVDKSVQAVVDENLTRRGDDRGVRPVEEAEAPAELWTAAVLPVRIPRA